MREYLIGVFIGVALLILLLKGVYFVWGEISKDYEKIESEIAGMGYQVDDVGVFLKGTDFNLKDFTKSEGLRKQYERFLSGESSSYMDNARADKKASDAESSARTAQFLAGASLASSSSSR